MGAIDVLAIDHDGLFKALIRVYPKIAEAIDPASIEFIEKEIQIRTAAFISPTSWRRPSSAGRTSIS